jgi:hypothetical protein
MLGRYAKRALMALAILALAGCGVRPVPSDDEIKTFLQVPVNGQYKVELNLVESFVEDETAGGSVKVVATYVAPDDLFAIMNEAEVAAAFTGLGIPADHLAFIRTEQPDPVYLRRVQTKGQRFPFDTDLEVRKDGDAWYFGWEDGPSIIAGIPIDGAKRATLPADAVVLDKASPHVAKILALSKEITDSDNTVIASFEKKFGSGKPVTFRFWQVDKPRFGIRNNTPFSITLTATPPIKREAATATSAATVSVAGPITFRGTPSDSAGRYSRSTGEFYPWKQVRLDGVLTRYRKDGAIKSAINLDLRYLDDQAWAQFHRFDGSQAYFVDGKVSTHDLDTYYNWRWAE